MTNSISKSILGKKNEYRETLNKLLADKQQQHKLQNFYFYYCKFSSKILGNDISPPKTFITEINNCIFLNAAFKSTKFDGIKFKLTKFINVVPGSKIHTSLMQRSKELSTRKEKYNIHDRFEFTNSDLTNCYFEDC